MKTCRKCNKEKPYGFFYDDDRYRDKLYPYCKRCKRQMVLTRYREQRRCANASTS